MRAALFCFVAFGTAEKLGQKLQQKARELGIRSFDRRLRGVQGVLSDT